MNRLAVTPLAAALLLAGCASTQTGAEWIDPQFQNITLRGTRVMVVCEAADLPVRKLCQDVLAAEVTARGATPVIGPDGLATGERPLAEAYQGAARSANARSILSAVIAPDATIVKSGPSIGIGLGGFGRRIGGGVGVSVPVGGGSVEQALGATGTLTNVASGRTMWTVRASTPSSSDVNAQVSALGKAVAEAATKAGFF
jgi:hypothetical protein